MGVDHHGAHIAVAQHLLNLADVVVRLQQMRGEGVPLMPSSALAA